MTTITVRFFAILSLGAGIVCAQEGGPEDRPPKPEIEMKKEAFLGIATGPVQESLRAQLGIDEGVGLIVHHVHEDSPAAQKLEAHDVVTKFDDQILVNHDQLAVLVHNAGIGTKINLTVIRRGAEQTAAVELGEREVPKDRPLFQWRHGRGENIDEHLDRAQRGIHDAYERVQQQMREARERMERARKGEEAPGRPRGERGDPRRPVPPPEGRRNDGDGERGERDNPREAGERGPGETPRREGGRPAPAEADEDEADEGDGERKAAPERSEVL